MLLSVVCTQCALLPVVSTHMCVCCYLMIALGVLLPAVGTQCVLLPVVSPHIYVFVLLPDDSPQCVLLPVDSSRCVATC